MTTVVVSVDERLINVDDAPVTVDRGVHQRRRQRS